MMLWGGVLEPDWSRYLCSTQRHLSQQLRHVLSVYERFSGLVCEIFACTKFDMYGCSCRIISTFLSYNFHSCLIPTQEFTRPMASQPHKGLLIQCQFTHLSQTQPVTSGDPFTRTAMTCLSAKLVK